MMSRRPSCRSWILRPFCRACVDSVRFRYTPRPFWRCFCFCLAWFIAWFSIIGFLLPLFRALLFQSIKYMALIFPCDLGHNKSVFFCFPFFPPCRPSIRPPPLPVPIMRERACVRITLLFSAKKILYFLWVKFYILGEIDKIIYTGRLDMIYNGRLV